MQIEIIETLEGIAALKEQWDRLYDEASPGVFMHHSWVYNNYRLMPPDRILLVAMFGDGKKLIGVFPFAVRPVRIKHMNFRALVHGGSAATDYSLFMIAPQANSRLMCKRVLEKLEECQPSTWDVLCIENLNDGIAHSKLFMKLAERQFYVGIASGEITPIIRYGNEYSEAKKISNIKRRFRKIADDSTIKHLHGREITAADMQAFSELHKRSFPNAGFDKAGPQQFYRCLIDDEDIGDNVVLSTIEHKGELIAAHFGFQDDHTFYYYVPTYNEAYSTNGPGQYLLWELINGAKDAGRKEFDLLRGNEDYKFNWTNRINTNHTVFGVPGSASRFRKLLVNMWVLTRSLPHFRD